jgi:hypothetical protein
VIFLLKELGMTACQADPHHHCDRLSECLQLVITNGPSTSDDVLNKIATSSQYLAAILKHQPDLVHDSQIFESLSLFSSICEVELPFVYSHFSKVVKLCLKSLPPATLSSLWQGSAEIGLCVYVIQLTSISSSDFFEKLSNFVADPPPDVTFLRKFIALLKFQTVDPIETSYLLPFAAFVVDSSSLLPSGLAFLVLSSIPAINTKPAIAITSAWLTQTVRSPGPAQYCRNLLSLAPTNALNLIATLCLEFPAVLAVLPASAAGFSNLALITLHRVKTFAPEFCSDFLGLCDSNVRQLAKTSVSNELLILDATTGPADQSEVARAFGTDMTLDSLAAALMFGRHSTSPNGGFISQEIRAKLSQAFKDPPPTRHQTDVPAFNLDVQKMTLLSDLIESNRVMAIHAHVQNPIL